ncbi:hypothetical protein [Pseudonocardia abyssalis]|nr:hypothetical protein [Pseudonocardia abyssalis]
MIRSMRCAARWAGPTPAQDPWEWDEPDDRPYGSPWTASGP